MVYIDPDTCIECGACLPECPVEAIIADYDITDETEPYLDINARYYANPSRQGYAADPYSPRQRTVEVFEREPLRVAIVGAGPAACYAAEHLLSARGLAAEVHVFERLPAPWGLVRYGVAPDHHATKQMMQSFGRTALRPGITFHLNVEVGRDVTHEELRAHHHAVLYAVGAARDRRMEIPGEDLVGCHAATELVAWYNGHPDAADLRPDFSHERAVIVGNGNVALDVARILLTDPRVLLQTDAADHAIAALSESNLREVVVLGRRGPAQAAYTVPELLALTQLPDVDIDISPGEAILDELSAVEVRRDPYSAAHAKAEMAAQIAATTPQGRGKRIIFRYLMAPAEIVGADRVQGVRAHRTELFRSSSGLLHARPTDVSNEIACGMVIRSIGYRGVPVNGVPFDGASGRIPNVGGRAVSSADSGQPLTGVYVVGWAKRGPTGFIGTNKHCALETVDAILDDYLERRLAAPARSAGQLGELLAARKLPVLSYADWRHIDAYECEQAVHQRRPRVKLVDVQQMLDVVHG
jgi:ferredoxin--NADP+ reductase